MKSLPPIKPNRSLLSIRCRSAIAIPQSMSVADSLRQATRAHSSSLLRSLLRANGPRYRSLGQRPRIEGRPKDRGLKGSR